MQYRSIMPKRQEERGPSIEQHTREHLERTFSCVAKLEEGESGDHTGGRMVMRFSLSNPSQPDVFAWCEPNERHPSWPKVIVVAKSAEVDSAKAAVDSQRSI